MSEQAGEWVDASDVVFAVLMEHAWRENAMTAEEREKEWDEVMRLEVRSVAYRAQEPVRCGRCGATAMEIKLHRPNRRWECLEPTCGHVWGYGV